MPRLNLEPGVYKWIGRGIFARGTSTGVVYGISYVVQGKRKLETVGPTVTLARAALAARKGELAQGRFRLTDTRRSPLFSQFSERYLEWARVNKATWAHDVDRLKWLLPTFGNTRIKEITGWQVEQYKAERQKRVGPRTVNIELALLRRMLNLAIDWLVIDRHPMRGVRHLKVPRAPRQTVTHEQALRFMAANQGRPIADFFLLGLYTGMRRNEMLALRSENIDLDRMLLRFSGGKTGVVRTVPIASRIEHVCRHLHAKDGFRHKGQPIKRIYVAWYAALERAGLSDSGLTIHALRHTFATRLMDVGVDPRVRSMLMGHVPANMTAEYTHPSLSTLWAAIVALEANGAALAQPKEKTGHGKNP